MENFEDCLKRLETIVANLERADLKLEDSVKLFEEGMNLVDACRRQLDSAEGRVEMLVKRASTVTPEPFVLKEEE